MSTTKKPDSPKEDQELKSCFIIMPISNVQGYELGHFDRVYEYIIKPACKKANFKPIRADDVKSTNIIVVDIIKKILECDMALCDLSSRNPNVLYELAIRQSFDLPVTLIKDNITERIFDIQSYRDISYDSSLRYDLVEDATNSIATSLIDTFKNKGNEINSIVELLGISKAKLKEPVDVSQDTSIILNSLDNFWQRLDDIEDSVRKVRLYQPEGISSFTNAEGDLIELGDMIIQKSKKTGNVILKGKVMDIQKNSDGKPYVRLRTSNGEQIWVHRGVEDIEMELPF